MQLIRSDHSGLLVTLFIALSPASATDAQPTGICRVCMEPVSPDLDHDCPYGTWVGE